MDHGPIGWLNKEARMNKVFCNKDTNMVEQILKVETKEEYPDDYFENCYVVTDEKEEVVTYNLKYNIEKEEFELVENVPEFIPGVIETPKSEIELEDLKKENEELKARLDKLEELLNVR